jgi:hypothetical protein
MDRPYREGEQLWMTPFSYIFLKISQQSRKKNSFKLSKTPWKVPITGGKLACQV